MCELPENATRRVKMRKRCSTNVTEEGSSPAKEEVETGRFDFERKLLSNLEDWGPLVEKKL